MADFQIVNGGQTTAAIYHSTNTKKYKVDFDLDAVFVQVKISVVRSKPRFSEIVSRIAVYSNTQNKVAISEHTANDPFHVELEKLSRGLFASPGIGQTHQTQWFYERATGQYKNARLKEIGKRNQDAFDRKNPRSQMFTKADLAKFVNVFSEIETEGKIVVGPHIVVLGKEKNYGSFINYNLIERPDNKYFEDLVAKAILFRKAEKIYGKKPNALGDLRYITVPYSLAYLFRHTDHKIDFYKIWKTQSISGVFEGVLRDLMVKVERWIKKSAPGALYGEWAKKEKCWKDLKYEDFNINLKQLLKADLEDPKNPSKRVRITDEELNKVQIQEELTRLNSVPRHIWTQIASWGRETGLLTPQEITVSLNIAPVLRRGEKVSPKTRQEGIIILNKVVKNAPEIIEQINKIEEESDLLNLVKEFVKWNRERKELGDDEHRFMAAIATGRKELTGQNILKAGSFLKRAKDHGFEC